MRRYDVIVAGAGAAGMMCALEAAKRGRRVLVIDHARAPGEKIRISGGGRCNFTNRNPAPEAFLSENPWFSRSALERYRPEDFIAFLEEGGVSWCERSHGQLFCQGPARQVVDLLTSRLKAAGAELRLATGIQSVRPVEGDFELELDPGGAVSAASLVVATGGKSIPKMGATGWGYELAAQFGLKVLTPRPALVPLTLEPDLLARLSPLAGLSLEARVGCAKVSFQEGLLFTHRGLSGPAVLQISSYWRDGEAIEIDLAPGRAVLAELEAAKALKGRQTLQTALSAGLPRRLAQTLAQTLAQDRAQDLAGRPLAEIKSLRLRDVARNVSSWRVTPAGTEGWRTAEVTLGGVDTRELDQKTFQARRAPGLFFIGEVVDVTGWLGGYNFQWAWSSGWCAGQAV